MKHITFTTLPLMVVEDIKVRNNREDLILQIVDKTDSKNRKLLAKRIALTANTLGWSDTDLHALLKKHGEVKNFSAFVNWNLKIKRCG